MSPSVRPAWLEWSPRVAPGLLTAQAWQVLGSSLALLVGEEHPLLPALLDAGVEVEVLDPATVVEVLARAADGPVVVVPGAGSDADLLAALVEATGADGVHVLTGSHDLPGSRLLDVVAVMDRLRSPGGCPWDAEQTHASLRRYLLEEAYEADEALEHGDLPALREELGDVLLQVVFHSRLAEEAETAWSVDDLAGDLVDKLVRRHPHVFADVQVSGADEVNANWDAIKAAEKSRTRLSEGVPFGQPALALTAALLRRGAKAGRPLPPAAPAPDGGWSADVLAERLLALVEAARGAGLDPEQLLRTRARELAAVLDRTP